MTAGGGQFLTPHLRLPRPQFSLHNNSPYLGNLDTLSGPLIQIATDLYRYYRSVAAEDTRSPSMNRGGAARKTLLAPIHFIFKLLQNRNTVSIWLYENLHTRIEGKLRVSSDL